MLNFDPEKGVYPEPTENIRVRVQNQWISAFEEDGQEPLDVDAATPAGQIIDDEVAEIRAKDSQLLHLVNQFNPSTAEGRFQDALGHIYFLTRKLDEPTVVTCQLTGLSGTVIPYGALIQSEDGHILICNHSVTIGQNSRAETTFRCAETGPVDIPAHSVTGIVTTTPGWDTVDNEAAGVTGRNVETRFEFEKRRADSVAQNAHGSAIALYAYLANLDGVLDVKVLENKGPDPKTMFGVEVPGHGATVCIYGGEDAAIAKGIYLKYGGGADFGGNTPVTHIADDYFGAVYDFMVMRPEPVNFWVKITLGPDNSLTPQIEDAIRQAILSDFLGANTHTGHSRVSLASTQYASRFYCAVMNVEGLQNLLEVQVGLENGPAVETWADVVNIRGDQEPVISEDNIIIKVQG